MCCGIIEKDYICKERDSLIINQLHYETIIQILFYGHNRDHDGRDNHKLQER